MDSIEILKVVLRFSKLQKKLFKVLFAFTCILYFIEITDQLFGVFELNKGLVLILIGITVPVVWFYSKLEAHFVGNISRILPRKYQPKWAIKRINFLLKCGYNIFLVAVGKDLLSSVLQLDFSHPVFNPEIYLISFVFTAAVAILAYFLEIYFMVVKHIE